MPAFALGLGQITVKAGRGEPLRAEIAIISSDPGELENLQARLASPETFARVGLEPPDSPVSGLQFTVALDPQGRPVIRVTSTEPLDASLLTFLDRKRTRLNSSPYCASRLPSSPCNNKAQRTAPGCHPTRLTSSH